MPSPSVPMKGTPKLQAQQQKAAGKDKETGRKRRRRRRRRRTRTRRSQQAQEEVRKKMNKNTTPREKRGEEEDDEQTKPKNQITQAQEELGPKTQPTYPLKRSSKNMTESRASQETVLKMTNREGQGKGNSRLRNQKVRNVKQLFLPVLFSGTPDEREKDDLRVPNGVFQTVFFKFLTSASDR